MALKHKIDQAAFDKLHELFQEEYTKQEDGTYVLSVEGGEDTGALKRAKDHEKALREKATKKATELEQKLTELQSQLEDLQGSAAKGSDKTQELERTWKEKLAKREKELTAQITAVQDKVKAKTVEAQVTALATELAGPHAELLLPHLKSRFSAELTDEGDVTVKILDGAGTPSDLSLDALRKEFLTSERFAPIVVASKATGSGAGGARKGSGGAPKKLSEMTATEEAVFARQNPAEYNKMLAEAGA